MRPGWIRYIMLVFLLRKKIRYNRILTSPQKKPSVKTNSLPLQYDQCLVIRELPCTKQLAGFLAERSSHAFYLPSLASGILQSHAPLSQWRDRTGITPVSLLTLASTHFPAALIHICQTRQPAMRRHHLFIYETVASVAQTAEHGKDSPYNNFLPGIHSCVFVCCLIFSG